MKTFYKKKLKWGFGISLFILIATAFLSYYNMKNLIKDSQLVDHTNNVLMNLENISTSLYNADRAVREYVLTGDAKFLKPYLGSYQKVIKNFKAVGFLTSDNATQQLKLNKLKVLLDSKFKAIDETVLFQRKGDTESIRNRINLKADENVMNNTLLLIDEMKIEEQKLLKTRIENVNFSTLITPFLLVLASLISILIAIVSFLLMERDINKRLEAENLLSGIMNSSVSGNMAFKTIKNKKGEVIDFITVLANPEAEKQLGKTRDKILGRRMTEIFPHIKDNGFLEKYITLCHDGKVINVEHYSFMLKKWIHTIALKIDNGIATTFTDITERKEIEEKIKEDHLFKRHITNSIPEIIFVFDLIQQKNIYVNNRINLILGYTEEQIKIMGSEILNMTIHPEDFPGVEEVFNTILKSSYDDIIENEHRVRHRNGEWIRLHTKFLVFKRSVDGTPLHILGISEDITKRKSDQMLFSGVLDSSQTGIMGLKAIRENNKIIDFEWKLVNKGAEKLVGRTDLVGKNLLIEMPGNKESGLFDKYINVVEDKSPLDIEQYYEHDGFKTWFRIVAVKWQDGIVINFENITERKQAEDELKNKNHDLIEAKKELKAYNEQLEKRVERRTAEISQKNYQLNLINKDLDNFIYTASHDLKAPINNIEGLLNALAAEVNSAGAVELIEMLNQSIEKFKNTIKDLTDTAKQQSEIFQNPEPVFFKEMLDEVKSSVSSSISESDAIIIENFSVPTINFSKKNLRSIMYNLISNAIKYRDYTRAPVIKVKTDFIDNNYLMLEVEDNGLGIKEEDYQKVFSMYQRLHNHVEGTGVGMSIVKKIIDNSGGKIELESKINEGSVFRIYFKHQKPQTTVSSI